MKILVVEDEQRILQFVKKGLEEAGFAVDSCERGDDGLLLATTQSYDAIILDIMLPGRDGLSVLRQIREKKNAVPVILLTARTALDERVEGLNLGADDYLTKPFYVEELIARLHALGRRATGQSLTVLQAGDLVVNLVTREVKNNGGDIRLTAREFTLLEYLMRSPGRVFSRTQILEHVWGYDFDPNTNLVDVHIQRLRKKLGAAGDSLIETIRGVGYRFKKTET
ncbi:MAG: response regulator transcription factor [Candidatus Hydrogenedentes bacterium]|nr:response regulator transcription factor [Candidatus Hydrogenedentota bacterium]